MFRYGKKQDGLGHVFIILIIVACLAIVGAVVWYGLKGRNGGASLLGNKLNDQCEQNDKDLCKFLNNFKVQKNYTVHSQITSKDGGKSDSTYELSGEDRFHLVSSQNGKEAYNTISIGDTTYTKDYTDNAWVKQKVEPAKTNELKHGSSFQADDSSDSKVKTTYKALGKEACEKRTCFKYQVLTEGTDSTEYIWFDTKEYLLRKTRDEAKDGTIIESTYAYDKVSISEPSPVKEAPATPTLPSQPSAAELEQSLQNLNVPSDYLTNE